jgi:glyoxylase-like metal-dependent hydrolase (beta-lactamase superfamily II)
MLPPDVTGHVPLDLFGLLTGLPANTELIPWDGPEIRILEHQAHAPGHAALLIEERRVLIAGDTLSDVLFPLLDFRADDPIGDYLAALELLEGVAGKVDVFIPGHGTAGGADQMRARIAQDRAYLFALRDGAVVDDPRLGPSAPLPGLSPVHEGQVQRLAHRRSGD